MTELAVNLELYEADLDDESEAEQSAYYSSSPRERFCQFVRAMNLPASTGEDDSALLGMSLNDLGLVWLAIHAETLMHLCTDQGSLQRSTDAQLAAAAALQIEMVFFHSDPLSTTLH